jgi:hypothetical protein
MTISPAAPQASQFPIKAKRSPQASFPRRTSHPLRNPREPNFVTELPNRVVAELEFRARPAWERRAGPVDERLAADDNLREPIGAVAPLHIDGDPEPTDRTGPRSHSRNSTREPPSSIRRGSEARNRTSCREPGAGLSGSRCETPRAIPPAMPSENRSGCRSSGR